MANPLTTDTVKRLMISLTDKAAGNEVATNINTATTAALQSGATVAAVIVATSVSTTVDFAALRVGDRVLILPAAAGNSQHVLVATAGTLPQSAVIGSLYVVLRAFTAPTATSVSF